MNIFKGIVAFISSLVFVVGIFVLFSWIAEIADSRPFQEIEDQANQLFYLPVFIIYFTWFFCIAIYFDPVKTSSKFKAFAKPEGESYETSIDRSKKDFTLTILFVGTIFGIGLVLFYIWVSQVCVSYAQVNWYKKSLKAEAEPALRSMAQRLNKQVQQNPSNIVNTGMWKSVFESDLECFELEREALKKANKFIHSFIVRYTNQNLFINCKPYEYWIDPIDKTHYKLRFNSSVNEHRYGHRIAYDVQKSEFYIVGTRPYYYEYREIFPYSEYMGMFEYDSRTDKCGFVYDNDWDNFMENNKWLIFLSVYILTAIICVIMVITCRLIRKYRNSKNIISIT